MGIEGTRHACRTWSEQTLLGPDPFLEGQPWHEDVLLLLREPVLPRAVLMKEIGLAREGGAVIEGPVDRDLR
jgi:hypothetical protein